MRHLEIDFFLGVVGTTSVSAIRLTRAGKGTNPGLQKDDLGVEHPVP